MRFIRDLSIRHKLTLIIVGIVAIVLVLAAVAILIYGVQRSRSQMVTRYTTLAKVAAANSPAALDFIEFDPDGPDKVVKLPSVDDNVVFVVLFDADGKVVAKYLADGTSDFNGTLPKTPGHVFGAGALDVMEEVVGEDGKPMGKIYLRASTEQIREEIHANVTIVVVVFLVALLFAVLLSFVLQRIISSPILRLAHATAVVSAEHDYSIRVEKHGNDELGALCDGFNSMLSDIQHKETELERGNQELESSVKEISSTLEQLRQREEQLEQTNQELDRTVQAVREAVGQLSTMGRQLSATVAEQSTGAKEQAASVSETMSTVSELAATSAQAAETAKHTGDAARRALEVGEKGRQAVADCVTAMRTVDEHVQITADFTLTLAERAHAIGEIINTVKTIAEQTNILALNAAIEASRAGEQGRGFAVVASDVKQLADQSKKATIQIREILGQIQDATNKTVLSTEQGTNSVKQAQEVVAQTGTTIDALAEALDQSSTAASQIVASSRQQAQSANQVTSAMQSIDDVSQKSVSSAQQVEQMATSLAALAAQLSEIATEREAMV